MYYEEKIRNGVTYFRARPGGEWRTKSNAAFTREVEDLKERNLGLSRQLDQTIDLLDERSRAFLLAEIAKSSD